MQRIGEFAVEAFYLLVFCAMITLLFYFDYATNEGLYATKAMVDESGSSLSTSGFGASVPRTTGSDVLAMLLGDVKYELEIDVKVNNVVQVLKIDPDTYNYKIADLGNYSFADIYQKELHLNADGKITKIVYKGEW